MTFVLMSDHIPAACSTTPCSHRPVLFDGNDYQTIVEAAHKKYKAEPNSPVQISKLINNDYVNGLFKEDLKQ